MTLPAYELVPPLVMSLDNDLDRLNCDLHQMSETLQRSETGYMHILETISLLIDRYLRMTILIVAISDHVTHSPLGE